MKGKVESEMRTLLRGSGNKCAVDGKLKE